MNDANGKHVWIFPDGDLPPPGEPGLPLEGHESLIVLNTGDEDSRLQLDVYFPDREPETGITLIAPARRVTCFRLDKPLGQRQFRIPFGQYALRLRCSHPVVAQIGRADVRQDETFGEIVITHIDDEEAARRGIPDREDD
ncbi:MAG: sensory rhodopsin transducer [Armatimonadota bacterium]|nr:sensory rhodopsin transducer [Armatimonadota bacterium]